MFENGLLILSLITTGLSVFLAMQFFLGQGQQNELISWDDEDKPKKTKSGLINISRTLVHNLTLGYAHKIKNKAYRKNISYNLKIAGLEKELNPDEYIGLQIFWGVFLPLALILLRFALQIDLPIGFVFFMVGFGFMFPKLYCNQERARRKLETLQDLPFVIDLLALSTEAGLDFVGAIQKIVEKSPDRTLGQELNRFLQDITLGSSRSDALKNLGSRLEIKEVTSFVAVVVDADQTGASISQVLKDQSNQMRTERFVRAEKAGARASQLILFPMMMFIMPAIFIIVFAPIVINFMTGGGL